MLKDRVNRLFKLAAIGLVSMGLSGCLGAVGSDGYYQAEEAESRGDDDGRGQLFKRLLTGTGLVDPYKKEIAYKERPPIVMPSDKTLPSPSQNVASLETLNADWPRDRDVLADQYKQALGQYEKDNNLRDSVTGRERAELNVYETAPGRLPVGTKKPGRIDPNEYGAPNHRLTPAEMKRGHKRQVADLPALDANGVPERQYLIEPPKEYRTPSDKAEYNPEVAVETEEEKQRKSDELQERSGGRLY